MGARGVLAPLMLWPYNTDCLKVTTSLNMATVKPALPGYNMRVNLA